MRKEFYIDNYNNFNFKTTFYKGDEYALPYIVESEIPDEGLILHISINKKILKDAIMAMVNYKNSLHEVIMFADATNTEIGIPISVSLKRTEDLMIIMLYNHYVVDEDGNRFQHSIDMRPYLPFDVINFLDEFKD